jgi:benzoyl-CoA reductase subunit D
VLITAGIDVGSSAIKAAVVRTDVDGGSTVLHLRSHRIRRRELRKVLQDAWQGALDATRLKADDIAYIASTGGDLVDFRRALLRHDVHARGAIHPAVGARCARAKRSMPCGSTTAAACSRTMTTSARGIRQFLENVARYLGVAPEDVGACRRPPRIRSR